MKPMAITYKDTHDFSAKELEELFLSVEWPSGHFPDKLVVAMKNFKTVYTAWDGDKLIGLICAMDDGIMTAYIHYLPVNPEYQGMGIEEACGKDERNLSGLSPYRHCRV